MKKTVKLIIDILLAVTFVLLFNKKVVGLTFHEIAGLGIGVGFLVHISLNLKWVKKVTLRLFDPKLPPKTRLGYVLNILLLIAFVLIIVSGLFISEVLFPNLRVGNVAVFKTLHTSISYIALILSGIHIGLHWKWIMNYFKKKFKIKSSKLTGILAKIVMVILLVFGSYQIVETSFAAKVSSISRVFTTNTTQNMSDGAKERVHGTADNTTNSMPQRPNGKGHGFDGAPSAQSQGNHAIRILEIISDYFAMIAVFAILTYYLEIAVRKISKR